MLFLHLTASSSGSAKRDYVAELAAATAHLGLEISPDDSWEDALTRVNMIGRVSHERSGNVVTVLNLLASKRRRFARPRFSLSRDWTASNQSAVMPLLKVSTPMVMRKQIKPVRRLPAVEVLRNVIIT